MIALLLAASLLAAPPGPDAGPDAAPLPEREPAAPAQGVSALSAAAEALEAAGLIKDGALDVEALRRALAAARALAGAAREQARASKSLAERLEIHLLVARAHGRLAERLFRAPAPPAARGEAAEAFGEQTERTVARLQLVAAAHARTCRDLAGAAPAHAATAARCRQLLASRPEVEPRPASPSAVAAARAPELQACIEDFASAQGKKTAVALLARLTTGALGEVESVALEPPAPERKALYDCLSAALGLWVFPGAAEAELELPLQLSARR